MHKATDGPLILKDEIRTAIATMKTGKAVGPDNISIEMLLVMEEVGIDKLSLVLNNMFDTGHIPSDLTKSVFITIP